MTQLWTTITLPGTSFSFSEQGRKSVAEMIEMITAHAQYQLEQAQAVLSAADSDFCVDQTVGLYVRRHKKVIQEGCKI